MVTQQNSATRRKLTASATVAQACRRAVADIENWSHWAYRSTTGEEWDAQPACFITDYLLAVQCFAFAMYIGLFATTDKSELAWYLMYFMALGISAALGGLLHHVAFEAMRDLAHKQEGHLVKTARIFGVTLSRSTVDCMIGALWRVVLACSVLTNFALLSLATSWHVPTTWAYSIIALAAIFYVVLAIWASVSMHALFLFAGFVPVVVCGPIFCFMTWNWEWNPSTNELLVYSAKLVGGLIQAMVWAPSKDRFNHNALSHVFLSLAATLVLIHYEF
ncbi:hypothetical protein PsorP6_005338 [Peronosclerospora sorghi]|uniref:Uncharacterized protein n=1 Tax=Peronosclerospora sorghi TaxID=230839 RepID=A0ACC0W3Q9_9STRA|nr:hypothetical protein PsorP6_005338 [Peronosclerospora sorghi]